MLTDTPRDLPHEYAIVAEAQPFEGHRTRKILGVVQRPESTIEEMRASVAKHFGVRVEMISIIPAIIPPTRFSQGSQKARIKLLLSQYHYYLECDEIDEEDDLLAFFAIYRQLRLLDVELPAHEVAAIDAYIGMHADDFDALIADREGVSNG